MTKFTTAAVIALMAGPVLAESHAASGDAENGAAQFDRQCVACHVVKDENDEVLAGRNARTGPNLYGVAGATMGAVEDFRYGEPLVALGEEGMTWTEETFVAYVQDPTAYLREATGDSRARSKMSFRVRSPEDAADIYAFLATFGGDMEEEAASE